MGLKSVRNCCSLVKHNIFSRLQDSSRFYIANLGEQYFVHILFQNLQDTICF